MAVQAIDLVQAFVGSRASGTVEWRRAASSFDDPCFVRIQYVLDSAAPASTCIPAAFVRQAADVPANSRFMVHKVVAAPSSDAARITLGVTYRKSTELTGPAEGTVTLLTVDLSDPSRVRKAAVPGLGAAHLLRHTDADRLLVATTGALSRFEANQFRPDMLDGIAAFTADGLQSAWRVDYAGGADAVKDLFVENGGMLVVGTGGGIHGTLVHRPKDGWGGYLRSGRTTSIAHAPRTRLLAAGTVGGTLNLADPVDGFRASEVGNAGSTVGALAFSPDEALLATADEDGFVKLWDVRGRREIAGLTAWPDGEWIAMSGEGAFAGTESAARRTYLRYRDAAYRLDQIYDAYWRPEIVADLLQRKRLTQPLISDFERFLRHPPARAENIRAELRSDGREVHVSARLTDAGGGIGPSRIYVNGKLAWSEDDGGQASPLVRARPVNDPPRVSKGAADVEEGSPVPIVTAVVPPAVAAQSRPAPLSATVKVPAGRVEIALVTQNASATVQSIPAKTDIDVPARGAQPRVFVISVGVRKFADSSLNLEWSAKDALDVSVRLKRAFAGLPADRVVVRPTLVDPRLKELEIELDAVANLANPEDTLVFFISTHGASGPEGLSLLAADYDGRMPGAGLLPVRRLLSGLVRIAAQQQLVIVDACYAGQIEQSLANLYGERLQSLARTGGMHLISATQALSVAREGIGGERNGRLTASLLRALDAAPLRSARELAEATLGLMKRPGAAQTAQYWEFGRDIVFR